MASHAEDRRPHRTLQSNWPPDEDLLSWNTDERATRTCRGTHRAGTASMTATSEGRGARRYLQRAAKTRPAPLMTQGHPTSSPLAGGAQAHQHRAGERHRLRAKATQQARSADARPQSKPNALKRSKATAAQPQPEPEATKRTRSADARPQSKPNALKRSKATAAQPQPEPEASKRAVATAAQPQPERKPPSEPKEAARPQPEPEATERVRAMSGRPPGGATPAPTDVPMVETATRPPTATTAAWGFRGSAPEQK